MVTAHSSWERTVLPRAIKNKSKPGHSAARPPQVIIAVHSIWKINTQNTKAQIAALYAVKQQPLMKGHQSEVCLITI